jgi:uncharacterized protein (TIGR01777 family)
VRVFVTGATGLIGRAVSSALVAKGHEVAGLSRSPDAAARLPAGVRAVTGDPTRPGPWQEALAACDACLHLAGEPIADGRWNAERKRLIGASRIDSTALIAGVVRSGGPGALVQGSAVDWYGSRGDEELDETSGPGEGFLAEVARDWEAAAAPARERARVVVLRMGVVLSREGGALPRLARPFQLFAGGPIGDGRFWMPWIHVADAVGLVLLALEDPRVEGPLDVTAPEPVRNRDLARALGGALGRPSFLPAPRIAVRAAVGELADVLVASHRVLPRKALALGYRFRFPDIRSALADLYLK